MRDPLFRGGRRALGGRVLQQRLDGVEGRGEGEDPGVQPGGLPTRASIRKASFSAWPLQGESCPCWAGRGLLQQGRRTAADWRWGSWSGGRCRR